MRPAAGGPPKARQTLTPRILKTTINLNLMDRVFGDLTAKQIRSWVSRSVSELFAVIAAYITQRNTHPTPFVWTEPVQEILAKVHRARLALAKTRTA